MQILKYLLMTITQTAKWQLLDSPITITEYISKPVYSPEIKNLSLKEGIFIGNDLKIALLQIMILKVLLYSDGP